MAVSVLRAVPAADGPLFQETLKDLQLDAIIAAVTSGRAGYNLVPFFHAPCQDPDTVRFRHEVFADLENPSCLASVEDFSRRMQVVREQMGQAGKFYYRLQKQALILAAARTYCAAVAALREELTAASVHSTGLRAFTAFLDTYVSSDFFPGSVLTRTGYALILTRCPTKSTLTEDTSASALTGARWTTPPKWRPPSPGSGKGP